MQVFTPAVPAVAIVARQTAISPPISVQAGNLSFVVRGNTLLPAAQVRQILAGASSAAEAVQRLEAAYRHAGYLLVGLRAQTSAGTVDIQVIEGQITQVRAKPRIASFYAGVTFDAAVRENSLIRRNILAEMYASRSGEGFRPSLGPASQPGGSVLAIDTPERADFKPISGSLVFGNYGSRYVGGYVSAVNLQVQPGDGWLLAGNASHGLPNLMTDSAGSRYDASAFSASKVTPWGIYGLSLNRSSYRLGVAGAPYYPQGETTTAALTGGQLAWASPTARLSLNQAFTHVAYKTTVLSGTYTLADQNYNYATLGAQFSRNVQLGGLSGSTSVGVSYNLGLSAPRGTMVYANPAAPQTRFRYWTLNLDWQQSLPRGWSLNAAASGQWALDTLPANQQWVVGGYGSLAAWTPGILSGDSGYLLRLAAQTPNANWRGWTVNAQAFVEQGAETLRVVQPGGIGWRSLADVGVGLTLTAPWKTTLSLQAARPIANKNVAAATLSSQRGVYLVLQQPF